MLEYISNISILNRQVRTENYIKRTRLSKIGKFSSADRAYQINNMLGNNLSVNSRLSIKYLKRIHQQPTNFI